MAIPAEDLATHIGTNVASLTLGTNLFWGRPQPDETDKIPFAVVYVYPAGGPPPLNTKDAKKHTRTSRCAIRTRGERGKDQAAIELAEEIRDVCHMATISGYYDKHVDASEPVSIGLMKSGRLELSSDVEMMHSGG